MKKRGERRVLEERIFFPDLVVAWGRAGGTVGNVEAIDFKETNPGDVR